jgi:hypothetical protein
MSDRSIGTFERFVAKADRLNETPLLTVQLVGDPHSAETAKV